MSPSTPTAAAPVAQGAQDARLAGSRGLELVRGRGPWVWDAAGRRYLDATSMMGVASLGHAHPSLARALEQQAQQLAACAASFSHPGRDALVARLGALLAPLDRVFLCNSGTESVEAAVKLARVLTGRPGVVALARAFHGRTYGALSATWREHHRAGAGPLVPGFAHVPAGDLDALEARLAAGDVALVLAEVVQGEGGVHLLDGEFLRAVQASCRRHGALFGVDEVQTGCGRTGAWFAYRHHDLDPDVVCLAKGLGAGFPVGAAVYRSSLGEVPVGAHGSTFGGNPLACAAALATLETLEREDLVRAAAENGARLLERLRAACGDAAVDVRGRGLMVGVELPDAVAPVLRALQEQGTLALAAGRRVLRLLPPLVSGTAELDELADAVGAAVRAARGGGA